MNFSTIFEAASNEFFKQVRSEIASVFVMELKPDGLLYKLIEDYLDKKYNEDSENKLSECDVERIVEDQLSDYPDPQDILSKGDFDPDDMVTGEEYRNDQTELNERLEEIEKKLSMFRNLDEMLVRLDRVQKYERMFAFLFKVIKNPAVRAILSVAGMEQDVKDLLQD